MSAFCGQYFPWAVSWPYLIKSEANYLSSSLLVEHDFPWFASLNIELNHPPLVKRCFWGNCNVSIIAWRAHVRASEYKGSLHLPATFEGPSHSESDENQTTQLWFDKHTDVREFSGKAGVQSHDCATVLYWDTAVTFLLTTSLLDRVVEPDFFSHCPLFIFSGM